MLFLPEPLQLAREVGAVGGALTRTDITGTPTPAIWFACSRHPRGVARRMGPCSAAQSIAVRSTDPGTDLSADRTTASSIRCFPHCRLSTYLLPIETSVDNDSAPVQHYIVAGCLSCIPCRPAWQLSPRRAPVHLFSMLPTPGISHANCLWQNAAYSRRRAALYRGSAVRGT